LGKLDKSHMIEGAVWLLIVAIFFGYTFEFNQPIEIYIFGATGWPRVVIALLFLAAAGNFYYQYHHGSATQEGRVGISESNDTDADYSNRYTLFNMLAILMTPFIFAWLLKPVGIYSAAPIFIALVIYLFGERRWKAILTTTVVIYGIFIGLFVFVLNAPLPQGTVSPFYDISATVLTFSTNLQKLW